MVVLGLVSTKRPALESADALVERVREAYNFFPIDHMAISPQCGFATSVVGNALSHEEQWRKLARVVEVAGELWG